MYLVKSIALTLIASAAALIPFFLILRLVSGRGNLRLFPGFLVCLYLSAVFSLTGMPSLAYWRYLSFDVNLNLVPFVGIPADFKNAALNVALFVPLGFLLPLLWRGFRKMGAAALFGCGLSVTIEALQMFSGRATDINDLITNGLGTVIGYCLWRLTGKRRIYGQKTGDGTELTLWCAITALEMFFVQPYILSSLELLTL